MGIFCACVVAENEGQDMADHGAAFEDLDGSESDEDGAGGDGGDADAGEMFGEAAFVKHGVRGLSVCARPSVLLCARPLRM